MIYAMSYRQSVPGAGYSPHCSGSGRIQGHRYSDHIRFRPVFSVPDNRPALLTRLGADSKGTGIAERGSQFVEVRIHREISTALCGIEGERNQIVIG